VGGIETDYLVVGAGAAGMAFVDALIAACDADVVMVDRRHRPGGHWNNAYPFVRLHGPSALYGVNSRSRLNATQALSDHLDDPLMKSALTRLFVNIEPAIAKLGTFMADSNDAGS
jgi:cation diffusion facilitator CzcD-associated flavoprotein CzcO